MGKWIDFNEIKQPPERKTRLWYVGVKNSPECIGIIKWFPAWRKYAFFPSENSIFEQDCLRNISDFIEDHTRCHKLKMARLKGV